MTVSEYPIAFAGAEDYTPEIIFPALTRAVEASGFTLTQDPKEADLVLLNTCAIREHAEQRVFGNLGILTHTKKENPEQVICLCGCTFRNLAC